GPGLKGVPRDIVKSMRILAYDFGYSGLAGQDKIGINGPWDAMSILGTAPVEKDGSAIFKIPANTPIAIQPLDNEGKAVQLMRTWMTAMPGEILSCVGCHESPMDAPLSKRSLASSKAPSKIKPWYGPARGFDFAREVQPVLNKYCLQCHNGKEGRPDLRPEDQVPNYKGLLPGRYDLMRMHKDHLAMYGGKIRYTPAYEALVHYIRRVNVGDDVSLLTPGHYHADTSELIQMLQQGHHGVNLDAEAWDRLITWIDLNGPCHGTWQDVFNREIPTKHHLRRQELNKMYSNLDYNPPVTISNSKYDETPMKIPADIKERTSKPQEFKLLPKDKWNKDFKKIEMGEGLSIQLVKVPAQEPFWMGTCEISNEQYNAYDPNHDSHHYTKRHLERSDGKGLPLNTPLQPVLKVSWNEAMAFCQWLSKKSGYEITLPSEQQWQLACRAGSQTLFSYGTINDDFSTYANMADKSFAELGYRKKEHFFAIAGDASNTAPEGVIFADRRFDDGHIATITIGNYQANSFGLHDMHGNVAEWTLTESNGEKVVKGGSYLDRPARCSVRIKYTYPAWQKVHNVGFRIVMRLP
ncbi:MAG: SUMF1/EgtB/PvdO family nonheme iron enzyme, partial [Planctomycetes bacterium]|nr:SUMF1/EgtB/PvdO family nonheme iron enzyme [Planctomycetota bacterium]